MLIRHDKTGRANYGAVLDLLDCIKSEWNPDPKRVCNDTESSKMIFQIEEGGEDQKVQSGNLIRNGKKINHRRDWLVLADIYNNGDYTQKFHLHNYIDFKLHDGATRADYLYDGRIRNAALYLYIREIVYEDDVTDACEKVINFYNTTDGKKVSQVNNIHGLHGFL